MTTYQVIEKAIEKNDLFGLQNAIDLVHSDINYVDKLYKKKNYNGRGMIETALLNKNSKNDHNLHIIQFLIEEGLKPSDNALKDLLGSGSYRGYDDNSKHLIQLLISAGADGKTIFKPCIKKRHINSLLAVLDTMDKDSVNNFKLKNGMTILNAIIAGTYSVRLERRCTSSSTYSESTFNTNFSGNILQQHMCIKRLLELGQDVNARIPTGYSITSFSQRSSSYYNDNSYLGVANDEFDFHTAAIPGEYMLAYLFRITPPQSKIAHFEKPKPESSVNETGATDTDVSGNDTENTTPVVDESSTTPKTTAKKNTKKTTSKASKSTKADTVTIQRSVYTTPLQLQMFIDAGAELKDDEVILSAIYGGHLEAIATTCHKHIKKIVNECIVAVGAFGSISDFKKLMKLKGADVNYRCIPRGINEDLVEVYLPRAHDPKDTNRTSIGWNVLEMAVRHGNHKLVYYLMAKHPELVHNTEFSDEKSDILYRLCSHIQHNFDQKILENKNSYSRYNISQNGHSSEAKHRYPREMLAKILISHRINLDSDDSLSTVTPIKNLKLPQSTVNLLINFMAINPIPELEKEKTKVMDTFKSCPNVFGHMTNQDRTTRNNASNKNYPITLLVEDMFLRGSSNPAKLAYLSKMLETGYTADYYVENQKIIDILINSLLPIANIDHAKTIFRCVSGNTYTLFAIQTIAEHCPTALLKSTKMSVVCGCLEMLISARDHGHLNGDNSPTSLELYHKEPYTLVINQLQRIIDAYHEICDSEKKKTLSETEKPNGSRVTKTRVKKTSKKSEKGSETSTEKTEKKVKKVAQPTEDSVVDSTTEPSEVRKVRKNAKKVTKSTDGGVDDTVKKSVKRTVPKSSDKVTVPKKSKKSSIKKE